MLVIGERKQTMQTTDKMLESTEPNWEKRCAKKKKTTTQNEKYEWLIKMNIQNILYLWIYDD